MTIASCERFHWDRGVGWLIRSVSEGVSRIIGWRGGMNMPVALSRAADSRGRV